ncbi:ligase-associated DNA damage response endonuclease PdeM [Roseivivax sp. CAU 1753]
MNTHGFSFCDAALVALPSGALFWPDEAALVVSDLHLGKAARPVTGGGAMLPPYDTVETLSRLDADLQATGARVVICLGDSFDSVAAGDALSDDDALWITRLQAGRRWVWIEGNHDPGPVGIGGTHARALQLGGLTFRHIAQPDAVAEVSGHYHPKARLALRGRSITRACFLVDARRMILPAYGAYTGGLWSSHDALVRLMARDALAILTGPRPLAIPMPR